MMDKLFLDTNVVIDLLGEREPFYESIAQIATLSDKEELCIVVSALTYSTVFYILSRFEGSEIVKEKIRKFKVISETSDLTNQVIDKALTSNFRDFEDALQYFCALNSGAGVIITRNGKDFKDSELPVMSPDEYLTSFM
ncbi:type II toxin-antitoxin system VapC family toxin [Mongoliitalea daihaiensis]|uniref:type II toxin-antitoxin system VapC family toxin n=1 Tax=Mongoliitalea daihaiensis TaxID=2782006 RepID=UPI001F32C651|nr:PIN domain-containing protein [Mongoliitalea daihaiensis]UJP65950.1 PIN domain-containing protein [Mongoliitalea daihaiensis]